ncbi:MAG: 3-phosphoglycerate dehydrogenase [SAR324 cluster bacterium]|nr:3-phosphoglycerate dehydrogenase [SAR324 cluster bacterium]
MHKILTLNQISTKGLERFDQHRYEIGNEIADPDGILLRSHRLTSEDLSVSIKAIARAGAGVNNIPVPECTERGIVVFNTPGANANAVKELVLSAMLLGARNISQGIRFVSELKIEDPAEMLKRVEAEKKNFVGDELAGKTLGIAGLGAIGSMVAEIALAMGMEVLGYDPALSLEAAWQLSKKIKKMESLSALVAQSDYITLHLPALESTRNLINEEILATFKKGSRLLNFSRNEIVDTVAVANALENGRLSKYITDFPHPALIGREDAVLLPHLGASTLEAEENCATMAADQMIDFLENGNIKNSVNFPALSLERTTEHRLVLLKSNIPELLNATLAILSKSNTKVINMISKSRGEQVSTIIDLEIPLSSNQKKELEGIEGILNVRYL